MLESASGCRLPVGSMVLIPNISFLTFLFISAIRIQFVLDLVCNPQRGYNFLLNYWKDEIPSKLDGKQVSKEQHSYFWTFCKHVALLVLLFLFFCLSCSPQFDIYSLWVSIVHRSYTRILCVRPLEIWEEWIGFISLSLP